MTDSQNTATPRRNADRLGDVPGSKRRAARFFNVAHWSEFSRGEMSAALEEPELLADDLRAFFGALQNSSEKR